MSRPKRKVGLHVLAGPEGSWADGRQVDTGDHPWLDDQWHIIAARPYVAELLDERDIVMQKDRDGLYKLFLYKKGTKKPHPIRTRDFVKVLRPLGLNIKALLAKEGKPDKKTGIARKKSQNDVRIGKSMVLTDTSKMATYSFNLPAGPTVHGMMGTCPSANLGLMFLPENYLQHQFVRVNKQFSHVEVAEEELAANPMRDRRPIPAEDRKWLDGPVMTWPRSMESLTCNSCYAIKGTYGNPSMLFVQAIRHRWVEEQLAKGTLERSLFVAVEAGQAKNASRLANLQKRAARASRGVGKLPKEAARLRNREKAAEFLLNQSYLIPNPAFFRIHDSGDLFAPSYTQAWWGVIRRMPKVSFWAPTRVWALPGGRLLDDKLIASIPPNLMLRPSALHFGDPAPVILPQRTERGGGFAMGSGSGTADYDKDALAFPCPAYLHMSEGGGAVYKGEEGDERGPKTDKGDLVGGTCSRARIRFDSENRPHIDPRGEHECRMCWLRSDYAITYQEH